MSRTDENRGQPKGGDSAESKGGKDELYVVSTVHDIGRRKEQSAIPRFQSERQCHTLTQIEPEIRIIREEDTYA